MPAKIAHQIQGMLQLESVERPPNELELTAYVFDEKQELVSKGKIGAKGDFKIAFKLDKQQIVTLFICPPSDENNVRGANSYSRVIHPDDWSKTERILTLKPVIFLPRDLWWPWWPKRICVSGRVRKVDTSATTSGMCPVPYVKVEIFDVDREGCWWPYIVRKWPELLDRPVFRIPELLKEIPEQVQPFPIPDPIGPIARLGKSISRISAPALSITKPGVLAPLEKIAINPQPEPPGMSISYGKFNKLGPQPEPPDMPVTKAISAVGQNALNAPVGEINSLDAAFIAKLDKLTLTAKIAPWKIFPLCFYSRDKICETYTDCDGYFRCCFNWWPWHVRRGRLRYDRLPDIILRITQVIDGVETVIYMDPYTSTRWNVSSTYLNLYLDDEEVVCGPGCGPDTDLEDSQAAILQIGRDEVWKINQADGMYTDPPISNGAYGRTLVIRGDFSTNLKSGAPKRYYKLSYAKVGSGGATPPDASFSPITTPLSVLRASFTGPFHTYTLGPHTVNTTSFLYEVQDLNHWWITPWESVPHLTVAGGVVLGQWQTRSFETDEGTYILRMEVFDENGVKMGAIQFPNHGGDGSGNDPDPVPIATGHLDLKVHIDNKAMSYDLEVDPAPGEKCGIIKWTDPLALTFRVMASQENGRVHWWSLHYVKGMNPTENFLGQSSSPPYNYYPAGVTTVDQLVSGADLLNDPTTPSGKLEESCAFAIILRARSHVRVNYGWHWYPEKEFAIAIEKCPTCPPCK